MNLVINPLYVPILTSTCRYYHLWGGRSRGASHFATDYFLFKMIQPKYFRGAMLRSTMNEITQSLWIALQKRIDTAFDKDTVEKDFRINKSEHTVTYIPTGNQIICKGFKKTSSSQRANLKGLEGITHAIVEEAEDVGEEDFTELDATLRTTEIENIQILVLFNPPGKKHWLIRNYYDLIPNKKYKGWYSAVQKESTTGFLLSIHSNFQDNIDNVNESTRRLYYSTKETNIDYYCRSVVGLISEGKKGRIFLKVKTITRELYDRLPYDEFYGLDFGYNDPAAVAGLKFHEGNLYMRQLVYQKNLDNDELAENMKEAGLTKKNRVWGDCAEPKSIKTLNKYGLLIIPVDKFSGSIDHRYRLMLNCNIFCCDDSPDLERELEEHCWKLDANKEPTDKPEDKNNHLLDGGMYALMMELDGKEITSSRWDGPDRLEKWEEETSGNIERELNEQRQGLAAIDVDEFYSDIYGEDWDE